MYGVHHVQGTNRAAPKKRTCKMVSEGYILTANKIGKRTRFDTLNHNTACCFGGKKTYARTCTPVVMLVWYDRF